ncbi:19229_t:CDS:2, partial [Entrophospora sp. SA101]
MELIPILFQMYEIWPLTHHSHDDSTNWLNSPGDNYSLSSGKESDER